MIELGRLKMIELGIRDMIYPVQKLMIISGQFLPSYKILPIIRWILTTGSMVLLTLLSTIELVLNASSSLSSALEILTILLTFIEMCWQCCYLSIKENDILKLMSSCQHFPVSCSSSISSERKMRHFAMKRSRRIHFHLCGYVFLTLTGYLILPFLPRGPELTFFASSDITASIFNPKRTRPLYLQMWLPWNIETMTSPYYEMILVWQAWTFVILVCSFCCADCMLFTFIIFIVEGLHHVERTIPGRNSGILKIPPEVPPEPLVMCRFRREKKKREENIESEYRIWVQQHQYLLSLGQEVERLFSPVIFFVYLVNLVVLCILAFVLIKSRVLVGILCVTGHFSCIVIKLYIMAKFGQELRDQSIRLGPEVVGKILLRLGVRRRKDARIIGIRCNTPLRLTGLGFFDLTIEVFGKVCSVALSYFIVLLQLH